MVGLAECARLVKAYPGGFRPGKTWARSVPNTLVAPQAGVGGFNRFAHSAGPGFEESCGFGVVVGFVNLVVIVFLVLVLYCRRRGRLSRASRLSR